MGCHTHSTPAVTFFVDMISADTSAMPRRSYDSDVGDGREVYGK